MLMPHPNPALLSRRDEIVARLRAVLGTDAIVDDPIETAAYECDGLIAYRQPPLAVALPRTAEEVTGVLRLAAELGVPIVPRGAGTSLSGGALPLADGILLSLARLNRILDIDTANRCVRVEAGVTNLAVTNAVAPEGFFYAPDPSSQLACLIGGNIAMNSGGAHCLKYGVTVNNLLGLRLALPDGTLIETGGPHGAGADYDLTGLVCGSEGQFGVVIDAWLRLVPAPEGARPALMGFDSAEAAGTCVADIIRSGVLPVALEYMDRPAIDIVERFSNAGYPLDVEALLIVEVEGSEAEIDDQFGRIREVARRHSPSVVRESGSAEESARIWMGRKAAFGAMGRLSDYLCMDGVIPTGRLPEALKGTREIGDRHGLKIANIFHAGDGNLHPLIMFDINDADSLARAEACGAEILELCVAMGGCLTGEHGIGVEKRDLMPRQFTGSELRQQIAVRRAFDPQERLNPGKVFPLDDCATNAWPPNATPAPGNESEIAEAVREARAAGETLAIIGGGSRAGLAPDTGGSRQLSMRSLAGIRRYEPGELSLTAGAGTPQREIEELLRKHGQTLAFEAPDSRPLFGTSALEPTLGGTVATGMAGPRRLIASGVHDAVTGLRFVNGSGEIIRTGGQVMKNVTGYGLARLLCGSRGTLGAITEVSLRTTPLPETEVTLVAHDLAAGKAVAAMTAAVTSSCRVSGAAHVPSHGQGPARTLLRIEGFEQSVALRRNRLATLLDPFGVFAPAEEKASREIWRDIRDLRAFSAAPGTIWRIAVAPSAAPELVAALERARELAWQMDLAGALLWVRTRDGQDADSTLVRGIAASHGAEAALWRAAPEIRNAVAPFPERAKPVAQLLGRLRSAFDPHGVFDPRPMGR